ncbi:helix-turn-helix domain-containing protein [Mycobacterium sp. AZCC_0083]|uniref:helix-turn-helix domain-containing protein n=1 Tax=Mycobacterium sp. AZCC_0083 TaxID=2735882 RepID=UPI001620A188|nr:helix-turn-helix domain-containing protein [Mycobacterium sp. AZCC_0083]MBB5167553.1 hypothetical protein [Mycobacterium sp. AZCC_0083]
MADASEETATTNVGAAASSPRPRQLSPGIKPLLVLSKISGILDAFSLARPVLTLSELRYATGFPTSTVQRLVANLVAEGFLERDEDRYRIGAKMAYWAEAVIDFVDSTSEGVGLSARECRHRRLCFGVPDGRSVR